MDRLVHSNDAAAEYPKNLVYRQADEHALNQYVKHLDYREDHLFGHESNAAVHFWQFGHEGQGFLHNCVRDADELAKQLRLSTLPQRFDPKCRFVFIHAPHSRERLNITRKMLLSILTYHQVMPAFLDFIFSYGRQQYAQDFHFSGFRHETRLCEQERRLNIQELDRSGRDIQLCYSVRSVERSENQQDWPWSIRQTSVFHSFDLESSQATWIMVKGDQSMRNRIMSATKAQSITEPKLFSTDDQAFSSTFATHSILCDWSGENWRWYINFLEKCVQEITRRTVSVTVSKPSSPIATATPYPKTLHDVMQGKEDRFDLAVGKDPLSFHEQKRPLTPVSGSFPSGPLEPPELPPDPIERNGHGEFDGFSFGDLQRIQFIEEKANETLLILKFNSSVLSELGQQYGSIIVSKDCPESIRRCGRDVARFQIRIASVKNDLQMQHSRVETLLRLLADRKTLLYGLLEYRSMVANKLLVEQANVSARHMEDLTQDMHDLTQDMHEIAVKTKQETVSMRIITLVTLFFLPGTFISTIMSTDIVHFDSTATHGSEKVVSLEAIQLYMAITLPLMLMTFACWYGVYWRVSRKDSARRKMENAGFPSSV